MLGIVSALAIESRCFKQGFSGERYLLKTSGQGQEAAWNAAQKLIEQGASTLLSWGLAGSLCHQIAPGELLVTQQVCGINGGDIPVFQTQEAASVTAAIRSVAPPGRIVSVAQPIISVDHKRELQRSLNGIAVDMESAAVARACHCNNVAFVAVRAIVDAVSDALPESATRMIDTAGRIKPGSAVVALLHQPGLLIPLLHQALHLQAALRSLRRASAQLSSKAL